MIESDGQWIYISGRALNAKHRNADGSAAPWPFAADVCFNWGTPPQSRYFEPSESVNKRSTEAASKDGMYRIADTAENRQLLQLDSYARLYYTGKTLCELIKAFSGTLSAPTTWPFSAEIETFLGHWAQSNTIVAGEPVTTLYLVDHYRIANTFLNNEILARKGLVAARYFRAPGAPELASDARGALDAGRNDETRWEWIYAVGEDLNTALRSVGLKAWPISADRARFDRPDVWDPSAIVRFGAQASETAGTCDRYRFSVSFAALARNADLAKFVAAVQSETRIRAAVNQASDELRTRKRPLTESAPEEAAQHAQDVAAAMSAEPSPADAPAMLTPPRSDLQNAREQGPSAVEQARGIVRKVLTVLPDDFSGDEFPDAPRRRFRTRARPAPPSPLVEWIDLTEEP